jgi:SPP1 family predicted phage head-tail adaptor
MKAEKYNMDERIVIRQPTTARSASGAETITWSDWRTLWAAVEYPKTGNDEGIISDQEMVTRRVRFIVRYTGTIQEKWCIGFNDEIYDILRVVPIGRSHYEDIIAELRT